MSNLYNKTSSKVEKNKKPKGNRVPVRCVELDLKFPSIAEAIKTLQVPSHVWDVIRGKRYTCGGYTWELVKENEQNVENS